MSEQTRAETVLADAVRRSLDGCLRAPAFRRSPKLAAFLGYIVEEELAGRGETIKAYTIATQALGRADSFDPSNDPSVRVEAGRLRRVLDEVYADEGRTLPVRILVPVGAYRPSFESQSAEIPSREAVSRESTIEEVLPRGEAARGLPGPAAVPARIPAPPALRPSPRAGSPLFENRGQAVLALLLVLIAFLLTIEIGLQIYIITQT
ncbi:hypothetical protein [Methylobacterium indicum]|uniref:hypothetical protein n=1 Tax=Methylobacterium indicum TaxID=1775910 RepID=UPI002435A210|nr:hypothetical protein [Methylobacterium indicum]